MGGGSGVCEENRGWHRRIGDFAADRGAYTGRTGEALGRTELVSTSSRSINQNSRFVCTIQLQTCSAWAGVGPKCCRFGNGAAIRERRGRGTVPRRDQAHPPPAGPSVKLGFPRPPDLGSK